MDKKRMKQCEAIENGVRCKNEFYKWSTTQVACSPHCAQVIMQDRKRKKALRDLKDGREKLKTLEEHLKDAEKACNAYIRYRDRNDGCISCGTRNENIQYAAGHYRTVKAASQIRFNEDNIHRQCNKNCNCKKGGNIVEYRIGLIKKIGIERVEALERNHATVKYTIEKANEIKKYYKEKLKKLKSTEGQNE